MIVTTQFIAFVTTFYTNYILKNNFVSPYILSTFRHEQENGHYCWNERWA